MSDNIVVSFDFPGVAEGERAVKMLDSLQHTLKAGTGAGKSLEELRKILVGMKGQSSVLSDLRDAVKGLNSAAESLRTGFTNSIAGLSQIMQSEFKLLSAEVGGLKDTMRHSGTAAGEVFEKQLEKGLKAAVADTKKAVADITKAANEAKPIVKIGSSIAPVVMGNGTTASFSAAGVNAGKDLVEAQRKVMQEHGGYTKKELADEAEWNKERVKLALERAASDRLASKGWDQVERMRAAKFSKDQVWAKAEQDLELQARAQEKRTSATTAQGFREMSQKAESLKNAAALASTSAIESGLKASEDRIDAIAKRSAKTAAADLQRKAEENVKELALRAAINKGMSVADAEREAAWNLHAAARSSKITKDQAWNKAESDLQTKKLADETTALKGFKALGEKEKELQKLRNRSSAAAEVKGIAAADNFAARNAEAENRLHKALLDDRLRDLERFGKERIASEVAATAKVLANEKLANNIRDKDARFNAAGPSSQLQRAAVVSNALHNGMDSGEALRRYGAAAVAAVANIDALRKAVNQLNAANGALADGELILAKIRAANALLKKDVRFNQMAPEAQNKVASSARESLRMGIPEAEVLKQYGSNALNAAKSSATLGSAFKKLAIDGNDVHSMTRGLASGFNLLWLTWGNLAPLFAGAALSFGVKSVVMMGAEVQNTMEVIRVLSLESAQSVAVLNTQMLELSRSGPFGPLEVAKAMKTLSLAGLDAAQVGASIKDVLNFAVGGDTSIEKAADVMTSVAAAFNVAAEGYNYVGDVIAKTAAVSKSSVESIGEAFKTSSVLHKQYGISLEDVGVGLAALSSLGIQGSAAGTALRNMYVDLSGRTPKVTKALKEMGLELRDQNGRFKDIVTIAMDFNKAMDSISTNLGKKKFLQDVLSERGSKPIIELTDLARKKTKETGDTVNSELQKLKDSVMDSAGFVVIAAAQMALTPMNQMKSVTANLQATLVEAFAGLEPVILSVATKLKAVFNSPEFTTGLQNLMGNVAVLTLALVDNLDVVGKLVIAYLSFKAAQVVLGVFGGIANQANLASIAIRGVATASAATATTAAVTGGAALAGAAAVTGANAAIATSTVTTGSKVATGVAGIVGGFGRIVGVLNPVLAVVTLGFAAWQLYDFFMSKSNKTAELAANSGYHDQLIAQLRSETDRLNENTEALRQNITVEELRNRKTTKKLEDNGTKESVANIAKAQRLVEVADSELSTANSKAFGNGSQFGYTKAGEQYLSMAQAKKATAEANLVTVKKLAEWAEKDKAYAKTFAHVAAANNAYEVKKDQDEALKAAEDLLGTKKYGDKSGKPTMREQSEFDNVAKEIKAIENAGKARNDKIELEAKTALDTQKYSYDMGVLKAGEYQKRITKIQDDAFAERRASVEKELADTETAKDKLILAAGKNDRKKDALKPALENIETQAVNLTNKLKELDNTNLARLRANSIEAAKSLITMNSGTELLLEQLKEETALEVEKYNVKNDVVGMSERDSFIQFKTLDFMKKINKAILDRKILLAQLLRDGLQERMGQNNQDGEVARAQHQIAVDNIAELEKLSVDSANKVGEAYGKSFDDEKTKKLAKDLNESLAEAILNGGKTGGKSLRAFLQAELRQAFKIKIMAELSGVTGQIAGLLTGNKSAASGGISGAMSNASSLNTAYGAASQYLYGGTAGASSASLLGANAVGMAGGDGLGALIAANGQWAGVAVEATAGVGALTAAATDLAMANAALGVEIGLGIGEATAAAIAAGEAAGATAAAPLLASMGPVGWVALAAIAAYAMFGGPGKPSKSTGDSNIRYDKDGQVTEKLDVSTVSAFKAFSTTESDNLVKGVKDSYLAATKALGIEATQSAFAYSGTTGKGGEKPGFNLSGGAGSSYYNSGEVSASPEAIALESSRLLLVSLQGSELPKYLKGVFDGFDAKAMDTDQINFVLDRANAFATLHRQLELLPFENLKDLSYKAANGLLAAAGGLENFSGYLTSYYDNFYSSEEKRQKTIANINEATSGSGLDAANATRESFRKLVDQQDVTTESGQKMYVKLLSVSAAFAGITEAAVDTETKLKTLAERQKDAIDNMATARGNLVDAYKREQDALTDTSDKFKKFAKSLREVRDELRLGTLSTLTPAQKYAEAKTAYEATAKLAMTGDETALEKMGDVSKSFLEASRNVYASSAQYTTDFDAVQAALSNSAISALAKADVADLQLIALNSQLGWLNRIDDSVKSVAIALIEYNAAKTALDKVDPLEGLYVGLLGRASDEEGKAGWQSAINKGMSIDSVTAAFKASAEYMSIHGPELIEGLYTSLLGRGSDAGGKADWLTALNSGTSLDTITAAFKSSDEYLHGSHANGLANVPFDGYRAELHKGERVMTAAENREYSGKSSMDALERKLEAVIAELSLLRQQNNQGHVMNVNATENSGDKLSTTLRDTASVSDQKRNLAKKAAIV